MRIANFSNNQFVDNGVLDNAESLTLTSLMDIAGQLHTPGLISASSLAFSYSELNITVAAPLPFMALFSGGTLASANGTVDGSTSDSATVDFSSLVPSSGSVTAYLVATSGTVMQEPYQVIGPPVGHPDFSPSFAPYTAYAEEQDTIIFSATLTEPDNTDTLFIASTILSAGQTTITTSSTVGQLNAGSVLSQDVSILGTFLAGGTVSGAAATAANNMVQLAQIQDFVITPQMFGAVADGATDCTTAFQNALNWLKSNGGGLLLVPGGNYYFSGVLTIPPGVSMKGRYEGLNGFSAYPSGVQYGPTVFFITDTANPFITLTQNSTVGGFVGYYPNQVLPTASTPTVYPYMVTVPFGSEGSCIVKNVGAINGYDGINISAGRCSILNCSIGAFHHPYNVDGAQDYVFVNNNMSGPYWDVGSYTYPQAIDTWVLANQVALRIGRADGISVSDFGAFSTNIGVGLVDSVYTSLATLPGYGKLNNIDIDTCSTGIYASSTQNIAFGYKFTNLDLGASSTGSAAFYLPTGGSDAPTVEAANGSIRGTWANGDTLVDAGTLTLLNIQGMSNTFAAYSYQVANMAPIFVGQTVSAPAASTSYTNTTTFTAPSAGWIMPIAALNLGGTPGNPTQEITVNGTSDRNGDSIVSLGTPILVASGSSNTVDQIATTGSTAPAPFGMELSVIFIPNP